ncbi:hypothetical protein D1007_28015 [Hordeum vulgare]|nr:hypothetical protein D1007_28015 [Hordeum vulgare]
MTTQPSTYTATFTAAALVDDANGVEPWSARIFTAAALAVDANGTEPWTAWLEAVDRSWRDWEDDGDWIWEDGSANPRVATTTSSRLAAIVDDPSSMGIYITRWSAKRLREIANTVKEKRRDVISKSSFGDLLHISPLPPPPEELVDFIVMRIDTKKQLLKLSDHKKIQLTRDMVKKLFNVPSGSKLLEFGKRGKADFREIYLEGERAPIPTTVSVLSNADDDDEDTINRTWILLCLSLVLAPGTGNMVPLEYMHTLQDMSVVHEFEWDEHILLDAMKEVKKYQDKRNEGKLKFHIGGCLPMLPVIYMDHIDIPRGCIVDHTIDYSLPRACFVKELDFTAVIAVDTIEDGFGKRPFSSTSPYATTKFLSYIEQLAKLPNKASMSATEIPDMVGADGVQQPTEGATNKADGTTRNVHEPPPKNREGGDDVCGSLEDWLHPLPAFDELELPPHMRAIFNKHKDIHAAELKGALSSFGSLLEGIYLKRMGLMLSEASKAGFRSDEAKHDVAFHAAAAPAPGMCKATANDSSPQQQKKRDTNTGTVNASVTISSPQQPKRPNNLEQEACIDDTIEEAQVEVSSEQGHDRKHPTLKRAAPTESTAAKLPKMKKKKIDAMDDAIYQSPSFIRIGGFDISFKHFSNGLKKRAHVNNEVMSLYIESFNIEHMYSSSKPRKFAFSPHVASKLYVDPSSFNTNSCTKDLKRACEKNDIAKADQLFFTIVKQDHWAVVVLNLIHKQFNVFDSNIRDSDYVSILEKPCSNLIENFKTLVRGRNPWKHNLDMFERFSPSGYPQQSTTFDCGLFAILYMENLTARGLKPFNTDTTSFLNFRKYIAAKLFKHPQNTLSSKEELEKLLKKS